MQQIIDFDNLERVHYRNGDNSAYTSLTKVYYDGDLIWEFDASILFHFTGIDANGKFDNEEGYNGTPIEYAVGRASISYSYYEYENPAVYEGLREYDGKYVYDENTGIWEECDVAYDGGSVQPNWVIAGVTVCYDRYSRSYSQRIQEDKYHVFNYKLYSYPFNNGINSEFFDNFNFSIPKESYQQSSRYPVPESHRDSWVPDLRGYSFYIPDTYNEKPVTRVFSNAFYYFNQTYKIVGLDSYYQYDYYDSPLSIKLGSNLKILGGDCTYGIEIVSGFNNAPLEELGSYSLSSIGGIIELPSTVTTISATAFGENNSKLIISSQNITMTEADRKEANLGNYSPSCLADNFEWLVFESSVRDISGAFNRNDTSTENKIVFKHTDQDQVSITFSDTLKSSGPLSIYTDNTYIRNLDWASKNYSVTFYPLSDYEGD